MMVNRGFRILNPQIDDTILVDLGAPHRYARQKRSNMTLKESELKKDGTGKVHPILCWASRLGPVP